MDARGQDPQDESIGDLVNRLVDDGRAYARAEIALAKEIARHRAGRARNGAIALGAGGLLFLAALIALMLGAVLGLSPLIGPFGAGVAVAVLLALVGYGLIRFGMKGLQALAGDEEEERAIRRGEAP